MRIELAANRPLGRKEFDPELTAHLAAHADLLRANVAEVDAIEEERETGCKLNPRRENSHEDAYEALALRLDAMLRQGCARIWRSRRSQPMVCTS